MRTVGLTFKDAKKVESVEKVVEKTTTKAPKKPVKKASAEVELDKDE